MERTRQLDFGLITSTAEEALQVFGKGKVLNYDFANEVNVVGGKLKKDTPLAGLLVYNEEQRRRILSVASRFRKHDLGIYGNMLQELEEKREIGMADSQLERAVTRLEKLLEKLRQPIDVELAPRFWQIFMDGLASNQKGALVRAIGSIHDLTHSVRMSYVEDSPAMTIGDLREKDLGNINFNSRRTSSLSEIFLMVAFREAA